MTTQPLLRQTLFDTTQRLQQAGCDTPQLDARLLLQAATGLDHSGLIIALAQPITADQQRRLEAMVARRCQREPMAYILGYRDFWNHRFHTDARALIPRPETEHLVEALLARFPDRSRPLRLCDIATGSGCIAISIALESPGATVIATDLSADALALAEENSRQLGAADRITFYQGDLLSALPADTPPFDAILSNPPYVSAEEMRTLAPELAAEPVMALTDGADGLSLLRRLLRTSPPHLNDGGYLIVETGSCGLPALEPSAPLLLEERVFDLAGLLRGGVYRKIGNHS